MKLTARTLVAILVLTGAAASTLTSSASTSSQSKVIATRTSMLPVPTCDPSDPNACGMAQGR
jgi:hypothetical protein